MKTYEQILQETTTALLEGNSPFQSYTDVVIGEVLTPDWDAMLDLADLL